MFIYTLAKISICLVMHSLYINSFSCFWLYWTMSEAILLSSFEALLSLLLKLWLIFMLRLMHVMVVSNFQTKFYTFAALNVS